MNWDSQWFLPLSYLLIKCRRSKGTPFCIDAPYIWALPVWVGGSLLKFACLPGLRGGREPDSGWGRRGWTPSLGSGLTLTDLKYPYKVFIFKVTSNRSTLVQPRWCLLFLRGGAAWKSSLRRRWSRILKTTLTLTSLILTENLDVNDIDWEL